MPLISKAQYYSDLFHKLQQNPITETSHHFYYLNGSYGVSIDKRNGTKIRFSPDGVFDASFPENIDVMISKRCSRNCPFCHEGASPDGIIGQLLTDDKQDFYYEFFKTLTPGTELALGAGMILDVPDFEKFLCLLKQRKIFANLTVHQDELLANQATFQKWIDAQLIFGLGVSLHTVNPDLLSFASRNANVVFHVINGLFDESVFRQIADQNFKLLILGYKHFRRGEAYYETHESPIHQNQNWLRENLKDITGRFQVVSFDNLAITQLNARQLLTPQAWDEKYMGDDATATMYISLAEVEPIYARNSTAALDIRYPLQNDIRPMFQHIKSLG